MRCFTGLFALYLIIINAYCVCDWENLDVFVRII